MNPLLKFFAARPRLALAGALGLAGPALVSPKDVYVWSMRMYAAQLSLLKMDWSGPQVFCTELSISYDPATHSCGKHGPLIYRAFGSANARP